MGLADREYMRRPERDEAIATVTRRTGRLRRWLGRLVVVIVLAVVAAIVLEDRVPAPIGRWVRKGKNAVTRAYEKIVGHATSSSGSGRQYETLLGHGATLTIPLEVESLRGESIRAVVGVDDAVDDVGMGPDSIFIDSSHVRFTVASPSGLDLPTRN